MFSQKTNNLLEGVTLGGESSRRHEHVNYPIELPPQHSVREMDSDIELSSQDLISRLAEEELNKISSKNANSSMLPKVLDSTQSNFILEKNFQEKKISGRDLTSTGMNESDAQMKVSDSLRPKSRF